MGVSWRAQGNAIQNCTHQQDSETLPKADWTSYRGQWNTTKTRFSAYWCLATPFCERRWNRVTRGPEEGWPVRFFISHFVHLCHSAAIQRIRRFPFVDPAVPFWRGGRPIPNCLSSRLCSIQCPKTPSCASSAPVRPSVPPSLAPGNLIGDSIEKPHPSGQSQLAAAGQSGPVTVGRSGRIGRFGGSGRTHTHSAVQRTSPAPIASSSTSSLLPSPLPYFFTRLVPVKPPPTLTLDLLPHLQATIPNDHHTKNDFKSSSTLPTICLRPPHPVTINHSGSLDSLLIAPLATALVSVPLLLSHNTWV